MRRKPFIILGVLLCLLVAFFVIKPKKEKAVVVEEKPAQLPESASNDLPNLPFTTLNGTNQTAKELKGSVILVFFHPDCDHCQREITQMRENREAFKEHQVYFLSDAQLPLIAKFTQDYKVSDQLNFIFGRTETIDVINTVGPIATPSVYIYNDKGKLVKAFNGETPIESILPFI